jgi:hypothetical protein
MYKLIKNIQGEVCAISKTENGIGYCIPFVNDNTDYANFKAQINADEAQLQDAEGNLMTAQAAKDFIKELP